MRVQIENLGPLKQAGFSPGDLTIICGHNNTGKTYATYAFFGFLSFWQEVFSIDDIDETIIKQLLAEGVVDIDIDRYRQNADKFLADACGAFTQQLPTFFAAPGDHFKETEFRILLEPDEIRPAGRIQRRIGSANAELFSITKEEESSELTVSLLVDKDKIRIPKDIIRQFIGNALKDAVFGRIFPIPFIASAERTGAAIFRRELNFARNRLLEELSQSEKNVNPFDLLLKAYKDYALPVKKNVDFTRDLETVARKKSFLTEKHPGVLADFADIIGGEYTVKRNDEIYYMPKGKRIKLSMDESSSAVRSLLDIGFYLRHVARPDDLLMVDEPELNLHPENQRRMARLFARLVKLGIKVFITTHSDYIIKELNTLIMLSHNKPHLKRIAQREGYKDEEIIPADKIKVYIAGEDLVKLKGAQRQTRCLTLTEADIDPELGIEARSFDTTIEKMNSIQEEIVWGQE